ncbi:MAG TPA: hypothetical protein VH593_25870 [Ktedonobacteraceae bacterium]
MEKPLGEMSLKTLIECGTQEMRKYHRREPSNDSYCLEILRRAVVLHDHEAWAALQALLNESVRLWFIRHSYREIALRYEPIEQNYVDDAFRRLWQAISDQGSVFSSLAGAMSYLHLCLNAAVMDVLRAYARPREERIPDAGSAGEPVVEDSYHEGELWEVLISLLPGKREQRLAYLLFHCNLKPREIIRYCPGEFSDESEIYRMKRNILDRILRNRDKIRWRLDDTTER